MRKIPKLDQCIQIMLCYEFAFIIQFVRPLFRWFLAISFDSDIHRDGSGKMLRAKLDYFTFLQEFGTNSDGWAILDCWTGYWPARSWHRAASTQLQLQHHGNRFAVSSTKCFHSTQSTSWYSTDVSVFIFIRFRRTHIGEYIRDDIDHQILFLANSGRY